MLLNPLREPMVAPGPFHSCVVEWRHFSKSPAFANLTMEM
jgi:hypothetical protein